MYVFTTNDYISIENKGRMCSIDYYVSLKNVLIFPGGVPLSNNKM